ncbi:hypothetical protein ACFWN7_01985 [Agromyces sp. NPDC058484]|uniref:hypothetical protein n=1 Tax=Agromyces sp. NPDC058484 TaxID=3346524 RepID=UPI00364784BE
MTNHTDPGDAVVKTFLGLLKKDHEALDRLDAYYVHLAFDRGLMVHEIAAQTGLDIVQVQRILATPPSI